MAQLAPITLVAPGSQGLNKEKESNLLTPLWATEATNCVVNRGGRISSRKGWADQTTNAITGSKSIDVMHEYINKADTRVVISAADSKIYKDVDDFTDSANDITSSTTPTADNWQFVNFNNFCIGVQKGHTPIDRTTGDFADISFTGTGYDGNCITAAFGRVWAADADLQTIRYSSLLDHTDMNTTGGVIDMSSVWTQGMDQIVAIAAIGSNLVVFGKNHIIMWADGTGSEIGLDPVNMYVVDTIEGTGCIARDSVQSLGEGDIWFLSRHGIQSLGRVIADKNNPVSAITKNIKTQMLSYINTERSSDTSLDAVRSVFSPEEGFYLLFLPTQNVVVCVDTKHPFEDDDGTRSSAITDWAIGGNVKCALVKQDGTMLFGSSGVVGLYSLDQDNGSSFTMSFWSAWLDLGELNERLKLLKEVSAIVQIAGSGSATYRWEFDFSGTSFTKAIQYTAPSASEYNIAEYSIGEYSGALTIQRKSFPGSGQGQFIRVGSTVTVNGANFTLQQLQLIPKVGRLVA